MNECIFLKCEKCNELLIQSQDGLICPICGRVYDESIDFDYSPSQYHQSPRQQEFSSYVDHHDSYYDELIWDQKRTEILSKNFGKTHIVFRKLERGLKNFINEKILEEVARNLRSLSFKRQLQEPEESIALVIATIIEICRQHNYIIDDDIILYFLECDKKQKIKIKRLVKGYRVFLRKKGFILSKSETITSLTEEQLFKYVQMYLYTFGKNNELIWMKRDKILTRVVRYWKRFKEYILKAHENCKRTFTIKAVAAILTYLVLHRMRIENALDNTLTLFQANRITFCELLECFREKIPKHMKLLVPKPPQQKREKGKERKKKKKRKRTRKLKTRS